MAKKTPACQEHCRTCVHETEYSEKVTGPPYPVFYCGLVSDQPESGSVFHTGELPDRIRAWIASDAVTFSQTGRVDSKVTAPCPGYEGSASRSKSSLGPAKAANSNSD